MNQNEFIFILAVSLQFIGSCLLLMHLLSCKRKNVISRFMGRSLVVYNGTLEQLYDLEKIHKDFVKFYKSSCLNVFAFFYLLIGYFCLFFSDYKFNNFKWWFLLIFLVLIALFAFIADFISKKLAERQKAITYLELKELGVNPDFETMSEKDIEDIIK